MDPLPMDARALLEQRRFLTALARALVRDLHAAEDLVQQTLLKAWERPPRDGRSLRSWLARVSRNLALRAGRQEQARSRREQLAVDARVVADPADVAMKVELLREVVDAFRRLPDHYRDVLFLRYYEDRTPTEIARELDLALETVKTRLRRGRERLRRSLERHRDPERLGGLLLGLAVPRRAPSAGESTGGLVAVARWFTLPRSWMATVGTGAAVLTLATWLGGESEAFRASATLKASGSAEKAAEKTLMRGLVPGRAASLAAPSRETVRSAPVPPVVSEPLPSPTTPRPMVGFHKRPSPPPAASPENTASSHRAAAAPTPRDQDSRATDSISAIAEELAALLDPIVEQAMARDAIPGAALVVVEHGQLVYSKGYGFADLENRTAVDPERTVFRIGSISKAVTALAALAAVDRGALELNVDVNEYLAGSGVVVDDRFTAPVTVSHLMTHTAGLDQLGLARNFDRPEDRPSLRTFLARDLRRIRPPGRESCYDTYGTSLLGFVLESVFDSPYAECMENLVFKPLGMTRSAVDGIDRFGDDFAVGYGYQSGEYVAQAYEYYASLPASSVDATPADMGRLLVALLNDGSGTAGRIFSAETAARLLEPQFRADRELPGFSYGFWEEFHGSERALEHGGTMRGYSDDLWFFPEHGHGLYVVMNRDGETGPPPFLAVELERQLVARWFPDRGAEPMPSGEPWKDNDDELAEFAGWYVPNLYCHTCAPGPGWEPGAPFAVRALDDGSIDVLGRRFERIGENTFRSPQSSRWLRFTRDATGRVASFAERLTSPGTTYERVDERLLAEALGSNWTERPVTKLHLLWYRIHEDWASMANAIDTALESSGARRDLIGHLMLLRSALEAHANLGNVEEVQRYADELRALEPDLAPIEALRAGTRIQVLVQSWIYEAGAYAAQGDEETACLILEDALAEHDLDLLRFLPEFAERPMFAPIRESAGLRSLLELASERLGDR